MKVRYIGPDHDTIQANDVSDLTEIKLNETTGKFVCRIRLDKNGKYYLGVPTEFFEFNIFGKEWAKLGSTIHHLQDRREAPVLVQVADTVAPDSAPALATPKKDKKTKDLELYKSRLIIKTISDLPWVYLEDINDGFISEPQRQRHLFLDNPNHKHKFFVETVAKMNVIHLPDGSILMDGGGSYGVPSAIKPEDTKKLLKGLLTQYNYLLETKDELDDTYILL